MINTDLTRKAMKLAYYAHEGQTDRTGVPYIFHPIHVAENMKTEQECVVALLHDVVEDTEVTLDDLKKDFPEEIVEAVNLLTHDESVDYLEYINKLKNNKIARNVKIVDIKHNSDETRLERISQKDIERGEKYKKALQILEN